MPKSHFEKLKQTIEDSPEITGEHYSEMAAILGELEKEIAELKQEHPSHEAIREALALTAKMGRGSSRSEIEPESVTVTEDEGGENVREHLEDLEEKIEKLAVSHPTIAGFLTALSRLM